MKIQNYLLSGLTVSHESSFFTIYLLHLTKVSFMESSKLIHGIIVMVKISIIFHSQNPKGFIYQLLIKVPSRSALVLILSLCGFHVRVCTLTYGLYIYIYDLIVFLLSNNQIYVTCGNCIELRCTLLFSHFFAFFKFFLPLISGNLRYCVLICTKQLCTLCKSLQSRKQEPKSNQGHVSEMKY